MTSTSKPPGQPPPRGRLHARAVALRVHGAPLLFISGKQDHLMPPKVQQSNRKHYKSDTITEIVEFEGPHLLPSCPEWREVADHALEWAMAHRKEPAAA